MGIGAKHWEHNEKAAEVPVYWQRHSTKEQLELQLVSGLRRKRVPNFDRVVREGLSEEKTLTFAYAGEKKVSHATLGMGSAMMAGAKALRWERGEKGRPVTEHVGRGPEAAADVDRSQIRETLEPLGRRSGFI